MLELNEIKSGVSNKINTLASIGLHSSEDRLTFHRWEGNVYRTAFYTLLKYSFLTLKINITDDPLPQEAKMISWMRRNPFLSAVGTSLAFYLALNANIADSIYFKNNKIQQKQNFNKASTVS